MIRKLKKEDINSILKIWLDTNIETHNFICKNYWTNNYDLVKELLPQSEVYIYEENEEILGFVGLCDTYIAGIFVSNNNQSKGIGKKLLNHAKSLKKELSLKVYIKNENAIKFYQRENFIIEKESIDENTDEKEFSMLWKNLD